MKEINDFAGLRHAIDEIEAGRKTIKEFITDAVRKETFHKVLSKFDVGDHDRYPEAAFFEITDIIDIRQDERQEESGKWNNHFYAVATGNSVYMHEHNHVRCCNIQKGDREKIYFDVNEDGVSVRYSYEVASESHMMKRMKKFCCEEEFVNEFKERGQNK